MKKKVIVLLLLILVFSDITVQIDLHTLCFQQKTEMYNVYGSIWVAILKIVNDSHLGSQRILISHPPPY